MNRLRNLYYTFPPVLRRLMRRIWYFPLDLYETLAGKRDPMIPPRGMIFIGSGDFRKMGLDIRDQLIELGGLQPHHRVLDVGCGIGRVAVPLTDYLGSKGSYEGFDIVRSGVRWCNRRIGSRYPNFRFRHVDLKNDLYNLSTGNRAKHFIFPYAGEEFDLAILTSVFTHMVLEDTDHYLAQIHRVLKPGGVCFATFFLMNDRARDLLEQSGKKMFGTSLPHHYLFHPRVREANVAYDEKYLTGEMIEAKGFQMEQVHYGFWPGGPRQALNNFQDICIFRKT
ncbi:MAG TPA: class I SAM-dependent methyltransferase [Bacteroides sp.]|nr:class I SAM-dependent methyltransferase [Bacteroides sp.]